MGNNLTIFNYEQNEVRTAISEKGEPLFCLKDVCKILDLDNVSQVNSRLDPNGVISNDVIDNMGRKQIANFINEPNLYNVIFQSRKEIAKKFQAWVYNEVLPSIRKTGNYSIDKLNQEFDIPKTLPEALRLYADTLEQKEKLLIENKGLSKTIIEQKPLVEFADDVSNSKETISVGKFCKTLKTVKMGKIKMFEFLRLSGLLIPKGDEYNFPYEKYTTGKNGLGYFTVVEKFRIKNKQTNEKEFYFQTQITGKGQMHIRKLLNDNELTLFDYKVK